MVVTGRNIYNMGKDINNITKSVGYRLWYIEFGFGLLGYGYCWKEIFMDKKRKTCCVFIGLISRVIL